MKRKICLLLTVICLLVGVVIMIIVTRSHKKEYNKTINETFNGNVIISDYNILYEPDLFIVERIYKTETKTTGIYGEEKILPAGAQVRRESKEKINEPSCAILPTIIENNHVVSIGDTYSKEDNIVELYIPDGIIHEAMIIWQNDHIERIYISESVNCDMFLDGCPNLKEIVFSQNTKILYCPTLENCPMIESFSVPSSVKYLSHDAFYNLERLETVLLPPELKIISDNCFVNCPLMSELDIPDSVDEIGTGCFSECPKLTLVVGRNTIGEKYAKENNLKYRYRE